MQTDVCNGADNSHNRFVQIRARWYHRNSWGASLALTHLLSRNTFPTQNRHSQIPLSLYTCGEQINPLNFCRRAYAARL